MPCESCTIKDDLISYLKEQLAKEQARSDRASEQLLALADPLAHARMNAPRPSSPVTPGSRTVRPTLAGLRNTPVEPTPEQVKAYEQRTSPEAQEIVDAREALFEQD